MKIIKITLSFILLLFNFACSTCYTEDVPVDITKLLQFKIIVTNADATQYEDDLSLGRYRSGFFENESFYLRPNEEYSQAYRNILFFFRRDALPNGQIIYEQKAGEHFQIDQAYVYDNGKIEYDEYPAPVDGVDQTPWVPEHVIGSVSFPEDEIVEFDLTFTKGQESRRILAIYEFRVGSIETKYPGCE